MLAAAVNISIFKAHSVRRASTSAAANASVLIEEILKMADWSTASTFTINSGECHCKTNLVGQFLHMNINSLFGSC